ncbi:universal stress protein [Salinilacihabitans rarus]|uniref:universal stress protein n=1 Tax=Salinilacihabitans rarus TaxID=2961596 RepID=UPI0020C8EFD2|nr:universal stress protein [Salinilacihabitans rarus]
MYDTILVPIDGSDRANRAVEYALSLADRYDATLDSLYVVETHRYGEPALSSAEIVINELEDRGEAELEAIAERADDAGIESAWTLRHGAPAAEILTRADEVDADLVVLGHQGRSHTRTDRIGSVAERVVRDADRPVLTV